MQFVDTQNTDQDSTTEVNVSHESSTRAVVVPDDFVSDGKRAHLHGNAWYWSLAMVVLPQVLSKLNQ